MAPPPDEGNKTELMTLACNCAKQVDKADGADQHEMFFDFSNGVELDKLLILQEQCKASGGDIRFHRASATVYLPNANNGVLGRARAHMHVGEWRGWLGSFAASFFFALCLCLATFFFMKLKEAQDIIDPGDNKL